jgi:hypothetical protein
MVFKINGGQTNKNALPVGEKISKAKKGKNMGPRDPSVGEKISKAKKGKKFSKEHCEAISLSKTGTVQSEESNSKRSESLKEYYENNEHNGVGKKHSKEHCKKISKALKGKKLSSQQIEGMKIRNSKKYIIKTTEGTFEVHGLKRYCEENDIPYVTLNKAFIKGISVPKYSIISISA